MAEKRTLGGTILVLLDETNLWSREQWAFILGVTQEELVDWATDKEIPRATVLCVLLDAIRNASGIPPSVFQMWEEVARAPIHEVVPAFREAPPVEELSVYKLATYIRMPEITAIIDMLSGKTLQEQDEFLEKARRLLHKGELA